MIKKKWFSFEKIEKHERKRAIWMMHRQAKRMYSLQMDDMW
ncbi:hypothetical protein [Pseudobacillus wudalianchiensis]|nr:hypothetical protein [Bacillus wudalianchiensis]